MSRVTRALRQLLLGLQSRCLRDEVAALGQQLLSSLFQGEHGQASILGQKRFLFINKWICPGLKGGCKDKRKSRVLRGCVFFISDSTLEHSTWHLTDV